MKLDFYDLFGWLLEWSLRIVFAVIVGFGVWGYVMNILFLIAADESAGRVALRIIGIFVVFIGAFMGWVAP